MSQRAIRVEAKTALFSEEDNTAKTGLVVQAINTDVPLSFSPDGNLLLTTSQAGNLQLWQVKTGRLLRTYSPDSSQAIMANWSPDGEKVLLVNQKYTIRLMEISTGRNLAIIDPGNTGDMVFLADYTNTGNIIIQRMNGRPTIFSGTSGEKIRAISARGSLAKHGGALSADKSRMIFQYYRGGQIAFMWVDLETGKIISRFQVPGASIMSASRMFISPDGRYLLRPIVTGVIEVIDLSTQALLRAFSMSHGILIAQYVIVGHDSRHVFIKGTTGGTHMYSIETGKYLGAIGPSISNSAVSPAGPLLAYSKPQILAYAEKNKGTAVAGILDSYNDEIIFFYNYETEKTRAGIRALPIKPVSFGQAFGFVSNSQAITDKIIINLANGTIAGQATEKQKSQTPGSAGIATWNLQDFKVNQGAGQPRMTISPDGRLIGGALSFPTLPKEVYMKNITSFSKSFGAAMANNQLSLMYDLKLGGSTMIWDEATGQKVATLYKKDSMQTTAVVFSPDGQFIASAKTIQRMKGSGVGIFSSYFSFVNDSRVEIWDHKEQKLIANLEKLKAIVDAVAFTPDGEYIYLGMRDGFIRKFHLATQKQVEKYYTRAPVKSLSVSVDGKRLLVDSFGVSLWNLENAQPLLNYISLESKLESQPPEFLVWTPEGYYYGSDIVARNYVHLVKGMETYSIDQFFDRFYSRVMVEAKASGRVIKGVDIESVIENSPPPAVRFVQSSPAKNGLLSIRIAAEDTGGGIRDIRVFHNGKRVGTDPWVANKTNELSGDSNEIIDRGFGDTREGSKPKGQVKKPDETAPKIEYGQVEKQYQVRLLSGENTISAVAFSGEMIASETAELTVSHKGKTGKGVMHVLAIGIENYQAPLAPLPAAKVDAKKFAQTTSDLAPANFDNFKTVTLLDANASKSRIMAAIEELSKKVKPQDTVVVFFAGHGTIADKDGRFYLVAQDVKGDLERAVFNKGISDMALGEAMQKIPAVQQVVFLDACQSGGADFKAAFKKSGEETAIKRLGRGTGTWIFSASGAAEYAYETPKLGHGLFTYALLKGITGEADMLSADNAVDLNELEAFVKAEVAKYARKLEVTQTPTIQRGNRNFVFSRFN